MNRRPTTVEIICKHSSPRPWTYHNDGASDWIEDAQGDTILNNVGYLDGPLIVACVNQSDACGSDTDAVDEWRGREGSEAA